MNNVDSITGIQLTDYDYIENKHRFDHVESIDEAIDMYLMDDITLRQLAVYFSSNGFTKEDINMREINNVYNQIHKK